jgi:hypothetical protein
VTTVSEEMYNVVEKYPDGHTVYVTGPYPRGEAALRAAEYNSMAGPGFEYGIEMAVEDGDERP